LDTGQYPKGIKISDKEMNDLGKSGTLHRHDFHGDWNYTVKPAV
jgi:DDE family transposase